MYVHKYVKNTDFSCTKVKLFPANSTNYATNKTFHTKVFIKKDSNFFVLRGTAPQTNFVTVCAIFSKKYNTLVTSTCKIYVS